jgi:hypothetical protein
MIKAKTVKEPPKNIIRRRIPIGFFNKGGPVLGCLNGEMYFKRLQSQINKTSLPIALL